MWRENQEHWKSISEQRQAKSFLSKLSDKRNFEFLKLHRSQARYVTGLLTGHGHLKCHFLKVGVTAIFVGGAIWIQKHRHTSSVSVWL
jgi:hypothetical protein